MSNQDRELVPEQERKPMRLLSSIEDLAELLRKAQEQGFEVFVCEDLEELKKRPRLVLTFAALRKIFKRSPESPDQTP